MPDSVDETPSSGRPWPPVPLPAPHIEAEGFVLRPWQRDDASALAAAWADAQIRRWTSPPGGGLDAARRWIDGEADRREQGLALDLALDLHGLVVGEIGCSQFEQRVDTCAIGFWVAEASRGRGLAATAVGALLAWAVEQLGLAAALAATHAANEASVRTLDRAGFRLLATQPDGRLVYAWSVP